MERKNGNQYWIDPDRTVRPVFSGDLPGRISMETMVILGLFLILLLVVSVEVYEKRRKHLDEGK
jgi:hypothetical protein